ncbi:MerR family transcriptional regulator, mercuric resistance operon regulatory protein [Pseudoxanthomonas sp. GM95]|uniref:MerR family transcriptional regulator n=1 Tax=Pseudoxanthomonas sp. GM95 TaxID=1881043 RepID=UPI0008C87181|nr:helix-turn-helix domain-containing protein [Pseudoxanthomonas sp. GM95]SEM25805.1 MerR family transcriptional regulator, mercuric resistance operon regulatory protein [Pseudoxanthomonas sp. GM95]
MRIAEAAVASGCHLETIRYYERIGLVPTPARHTSGYRDYGDEDVARLGFIHRARDLGFSLDEIRGLLTLARDDSQPCAEVDVLARRHLEDVRQRIADLQRVADALEQTLARCSRNTRRDCTLLQTLQRA